MLKEFLYMQVPLGVIPKDETNYEDMMDILEHIHQYVPAKEVHREVVDPLTEEVMTIIDHHLVTTLVGGDQLTTARVRGAQLIRDDCDLSKDRLAGVLPITEDWHAKLCLMKVINLFLVNFLEGLSPTHYSHTGDMETVIQDPIWDGKRNAISIA